MLRGYLLSLVLCLYFIGGATAHAYETEFSLSDTSVYNKTMLERINKSHILMRTMISINIYED